MLWFMYRCPLRSHMLEGGTVERGFDDEFVIVDRGCVITGLAH